MFKRITLSTALVLATLSLATAGHAASDPKPTVVLVHGAFAGSSSWNNVAARLERDGYTVIAAANELRSVKGDSDYVAALVSSIKGPVVLVGHSYAGSIISTAATGKPNVKALVFVSAFLPEAGETGLELSNKFPGSTLGPAIAPPVPLPDGGQDLYIIQDKFPAQFAADLPLEDARLMAATQRPITQAALGEGAGRARLEDDPVLDCLWQRRQEHSPRRLHAFMAKRANVRKAVEVPGSSHVVMISHPAIVAGPHRGSGQRAIAGRARSRSSEAARPHEPRRFAISDGCRG